MSEAISFQSLARGFAEAEAFHTIADKIAGTLRKTNSFVKTVAYVPDNVSRAFQATKFLGTVGLAYEMVGLYRSICALINANNVIDRVKSAAKTMLGLKAIPDAATDTIDGLKAVGVLAKNALPLADGVGKVVYPIQFLSVGLGMHSLYETFRLRQEISQNISKKNVTSSCEYIAANAGKLKSRLNITTDIGAIAKSALEDTSKLDGQELVKKIKNRITTQLVLGVLSVALKVASFIVTGFALFAAPHLAVITIGAGLSIMSLLHFADEKMTLNKDLYSKPKDVWHQKFAHIVRVNTQEASKVIYKAFKNNANNINYYFNK